MAEGKTAKDIAGLLVLGLSTVEFHRANAYRKLGLNELPRGPLRQRELQKFFEALNAVPEPGQASTGPTQAPSRAVPDSSRIDAIDAFFNTPIPLEKIGLLVLVVALSIGYVLLILASCAYEKLHDVVGEKLNLPTPQRKPGRERMAYEVTCILSDLLRVVRDPDAFKAGPSKLQG